MLKPCLNPPRLVIERTMESVSALALLHAEASMGLRFEHLGRTEGVFATVVV